MTLELNRIYNMDCLEGMRQIEDKSVDLVLTDPPYGIKLTNEKLQTRKQLADPIDYGHFDWDMEAPPQECFLNIYRISKNQVIFGGNYFALSPTPCWIVWDKDNSGDFADAELAWTSFTTPVRIFKWRWNGMLQQDMAHKETRIHPTQKPVPLFEWILKNYAKTGHIICDPFVGSGSVCVAAARLGLPFIGFEKEQSYFDAAEKRIKKAQGQGKIEAWF